MKTLISINPKLPTLKRFVIPVMISYMDFINNELKIQFRITYEDSEGVDIGISKDIYTHLSDSNKVTSEGQMITRELFPIMEDETEVDYEIRFNELFDSGFDEFSFWWENAKIKNIEESIVDGIQLLDSYAYFD